MAFLEILESRLFLSATPSLSALLKASTPRQSRADVQLNHIEKAYDTAELALSAASTRLSTLRQQNSSKKSILQTENKLRARIQTDQSRIAALEAKINELTGGAVAATTNTAAGTSLRVGSINSSNSFDSLTIGTGTEVAIPISTGNTAGANHQAIVVNALNFSGSSGDSGGLLDLGDNDMIVHYGSFAAAEAALATIQNQIAGGHGSAGGGGSTLWTGTSGITSSAATNVYSAEAYQNAALGFAGGLPPGDFITFDGIAVSSGDLLIKYTQNAAGEAANG